MIRLIIDVATMRVVYFTKNPNESLAVVDQTLMYDYAFDLPVDFSIDNCWNWKLVGNKLVYSNPAKAEPPSLLENNKKEVVKFLREKINQERAPYLGVCNGSDYIRIVKEYERQLPASEFIEKLAEIKNMSVEEYNISLIKEYQQADRILKATEINLEYYTKKINEVDNDWDLHLIRDEIGRTDLTVK